MNEYPLQAFIELVNFDQVTYALEDEINQIQKEIGLLEQKRADLHSGSNLIASKMHEARKEVDQAELEMKTLEEREQEEKRCLDVVTNQKEYQSILKEIEALKRRQHDYESTLLVAWSTFETAKKEHEALVAEEEQWTKELNTSIDQRREKLLSLQADLEARQAVREEKKKEIPPEWLDKYVLMKSRVANPVVPVVNKNCTACFYHLPAQDFLDLTRNKMLQCKGCYRFLYLESPKKVE